MLKFDFSNYSDLLTLDRWKEISGKYKITSIVVLVVLIAGLALSVYLVRFRQIFSSHASEESQIVPINDQGGPLPTNSQGQYVSKSTSVRLHLFIPNPPSQ